MKLNFEILLSVLLVTTAFAQESTQIKASAVQSASDTEQTAAPATQSSKLKLDSVEALDNKVSQVMGDDFFANTDRWTSSFFSLASTKTDQISAGAASVDTYNYVGLNKRLTDVGKFALRIPFLYNTSGFNKYGEYQTQAMKLHDIILAYVNYDLAYIGPVEVGGTFKIYLPTSEYSKKQRMIARLRPEMYFSYFFGRYSVLAYIVKPDYYIQSQTAYYDDTTPTRDDGSFVTDPRKTNKIASFEHFVQLSLDINKYFSHLTEAGFSEDWYYGSEAENLSGSHVTYGRVATGFEIRPLKLLRFSLTIENKPLLNSTRYSNVGFFRPRDNSIVLQTNAAVF